MTITSVSKREARGITRKVNSVRRMKMNGREIKDYALWDGGGTDIKHQPRQTTVSTAAVNTGGG